MMELDFCSCDYAEDFEALVDLNYIFNDIPEGFYDLWLKAYDTSCRETEHESRLNDNGYGFECFVWVSAVERPVRSNPIVVAQAASKEDAERILTEAFENIASDFSIIETAIKEI